LNGNSTLRPGDVKYKNLNGDKVLNWRDQTIIGYGSMPHWMYGFNTMFKYKNFDLNMLFQGSFAYTTYIYLEGVQTDFRFEHRWTEINNDPFALVPRPGSSGANGLTSDYRNHNTSYIRLKNAALGYDVPLNPLKKVGIEKLRIYVAGTNLLTFSNINKYGVDPEMSDGDPSAYYPQQRTISMGVNISF
jgi:hypothetical protein